MARLIRVSDENFARFAYLVGQLHLKQRRFISADEAFGHLLDKQGIPKKLGKRTKKISRHAGSAKRQNRWKKRGETRG